MKGQAETSSRAGRGVEAGSHTGSPVPTSPTPRRRATGRPAPEVRIVTITPLSGRVVLWRGPNNRTAVKRFNQLSSRYAARGLRVWVEPA